MKAKLKSIFFKAISEKHRNFLCGIYPYTLLLMLLMDVMGVFSTFAGVLFNFPWKKAEKYSSCTLIYQSYKIYVCYKCLWYSTKLNQHHLQNSLKQKAHLCPTPP